MNYQTLMQLTVGLWFMILKFADIIFPTVGQEVFMVRLIMTMSVLIESCWTEQTKLGNECVSFQLNMKETTSWFSKNSPKHLNSLSKLHIHSINLFMQRERSTHTIRNCKQKVKNRFWVKHKIANNTWTFSISLSVAFEDWSWIEKISNEATKLRFIVCCSNSASKINFSPTRMHQRASLREILLCKLHRRFWCQRPTWRW